MSARGECPACVSGIGFARKATVAAGKPFVTVTLVCDSCGHEWDVAFDSKPLRPNLDPQEKKAAS
jgi:hypothetical protein